MEISTSLVSIQSPSEFRNTPQLRGAKASDDLARVLHSEPVVSRSELDISAQAQFLFKVDRFLSELNENDLSHALDFLSKSTEPLQNMAASYYIESKNVLQQFTPELREQAKKLSEIISEKGHVLDAEFSLTDDTKVIVVPLATVQFRLDGKQDSYPVQLNERNIPLHNRLDALEPTAYAVLDNQDAANLLGAVKHALNASETIQLSFDDVLYYQYTIEKASEAIKTISLPSELSKSLNSLIQNGITYQNQKQTKFMVDVGQYTGNNRVGESASADLMLASAAHKLNNQLTGELSGSGRSLLDSEPVFRRLLVEHSELIRFSPQKLNDALDYYRADFSSFKKVLAQDYAQGDQSLISSLINTSALAEGDVRAAALIAKIQP